MYNGSFQAFCEFDDYIMRARAPRSAEHRNPIVVVKKCREAMELLLRWRCHRPTEHKGFCSWHRRIQGWLQCDVSREHNDRNAAIANGLSDGNLQGARHLVGARDELTIVTALLEQVLGMSFLEISSADLGGRDLGRDSKYRHARALAVVQAIYQVHVPGSAAAGADREFSCEMRLGASSESSDLLVSHMYPLDLALAADRISQAVQAVADDAVYSLDAGGSERFRKLISYCLGHNTFLLMRGDFR
jgi:hypothetical protein